MSDACDPGSAGDEVTSVELGRAGEGAFEAIADGETIPITYGTQGGA